MENSIQIQSITIKNFRSIRRASIKAEVFNIFVGMNDAGKSNVLKPSTFFNDCVESETPFDYDRDFSYLFPKTSKEAKKVTISVQFFIPESFMENGVYTWRKEWNKDGKVTDEILNGQNVRPVPVLEYPLL